MIWEILFEMDPCAQNTDFKWAVISNQFLKDTAEVITC